MNLLETSYRMRNERLYEYMDYKDKLFYNNSHLDRLKREIISPVLLGVEDTMGLSIVDRERREMREYFRVRQLLKTECVLKEAQSKRSEGKEAAQLNEAYQIIGEMLKL